MNRASKLSLPFRASILTQIQNLACCILIRMRRSHRGDKYPPLQGLNVNPINTGFAVSQNQADASYIEQLGMSFVALRLNVTPETVDAQHQQLLRYVLPASQNSLKVQLAEDAKRIKDNNVNSTFYMTSMRAWPAENRVDIRGELKTWIGDSKPYSEIKSYVIQFSRVDGVSWLARFGEINNEKN